MFRTVFPSIIRSLRLYTQHRVYVVQVLWLLASKQTPDALCTVLDAWWWMEIPSETCRVFFQNKIEILCTLLIFTIEIYYDARFYKLQIIHLSDWRKVASAQYNVPYTEPAAILVLCRNEGKIHSITWHEGLDGQQMHSSTISLTSVLDGDGMFNAKPLPLYPQECPVRITREVWWAPGDFW
jgi:hypothetical protein